MLASVPHHVRFVPVDFNSEPLQGKMSAAGYDPRRRTLFIWESVTNYLTEDAVDGTLRWCAGAAAGSTVVFTYVHRLVLDAPQAFYGTEKLFMTLSTAGERWTFGLDPSQLSSFLAQRGLVLSEDVGASDYRALYLGRAAMRRGYEFYRIAVARVPDPPLTPKRPPRFHRPARFDNRFGRRRGNRCAGRWWHAVVLRRGQRQIDRSTSRPNWACNPATGSLHRGASDSASNATRRSAPGSKAGQYPRRRDMRFSGTRMWPRPWRRRGERPEEGHHVGLHLQRPLPRERGVHEPPARS